MCNPVHIELFFSSTSFAQMETLRSSSNEIVKILFLNPLSKTGNLTVAYNHQMPVAKSDSTKTKWGAALVAEKNKERAKAKVNHNKI